MTPFSYPKTKHTRTKAPKRDYADYRSYKKPLRVEFLRKCVYCRMPDSMKGYEAFGVDHYRPKDTFPKLVTSYSNLFYCCNACNSRKGNYWPAPGLTTMRFIPNPCDHIMFAHVKFVGREVVPRTSPGSWTVDLLDLNDPEAVEFREFIEETIELYAEDEARLKRLKNVVQEKARSGDITVAQAQQTLQDIGAKLFKVTKHLARLRGE